MRERRALSPSFSFRAYADRAVLVDHATGSLHLLNAEGGALLERLDRGEGALADDEEEFLEEIGRPGQAPDGPDGPDGPDDLLDELNRWAADRLIPLHCQLELTYRCRLRCRHCYLGHAGGDPDTELSTREVVHLLDALRRLGCLFLLLTGGEPFLRGDLEEIFAAARDRRFAVSFATSGWGVERPLLERLARRGIDAAQVSLYGPDAAAHDAVTGQPGSFAAALACLRALRDLGVRVRAAVTPSAGTVGRIGQVRDLLARERIPAALGLYMAPRRDGSRDPQALAVGEDGIRAALAAFPPGAPPRLRGRGLGDRPCGAGAAAVSVDPTGQVHPCLQLRLPVGSVRERPLAELWEGAAPLRELRGLRVGDLVGCPTCADREWCNRCAGLAFAEGASILDHCSFDCLQARVQNELQDVPKKEVARR